MASDILVSTRQSKQVAFDKSLVAELTQGESDFYLVCLNPAQRWLLLTLLEFYVIFDRRWINGWTVDEYEELASETLWRLICPVTCEQQFQQLNDTLAQMSVTMLEIRDRLGPPEGNIDLRLSDISTDLEDIKVAIEESFPDDLFDQLEPILNGVGVILGASSVPTP